MDFNELGFYVFMDEQEKQKNNSISIRVSSEKAEEIIKLQQAKDSNAITESEFNVKIKKILGI